MRSQQINHRYSFPPPATMKTVLLKPLLPEEHTSSSTEAPEDRLVGICFKYIPSSLVVPQEKLEPFESPLTESNLKFHTTIVSIIIFTNFFFEEFLRMHISCLSHGTWMTVIAVNSQSDKITPRSCRHTLNSTILAAE